MYIIGDVHGKIKELESILDNLSNDTIILNGDIGFQKSYNSLFEMLNRKKYKNNIFINMGNHDYYPYKYLTLGNYFLFAKEKLITIRGAYSIDKHLRTSGLDWFEDEELNYKSSNHLLERFRKSKPEIIVSHDCPESLYPYLISGNYISNHTAKLLQECLNIHKPKKWVFGHHHKSWSKIIDNTEFICLNELESYQL